MPAIEVDRQDMRRFNAAVRKAADRDLPKKIGQVNKQVGKLVISKLSPRPVPEAVGAGAGAAVRPSATKREVVLRVGGKHRDGADPRIVRMRQWGKRSVRPFRASPPRPYIIETAEQHRDEILDLWMDGILAATRPAFAEVSDR